MRKPYRKPRRTVDADPHRQGQGWDADDSYDPEESDGTFDWFPYIYPAAILLVLILTLVFGLRWALSSAEAHSWYDGTCCNEGDCRQTTLGEVERRDNGWYVVPTSELIPFDDKRIKQSLDPLIHRCVFTYAVPSFVQGGVTTDAKKPGDTRCLYVSTPGG